MAPNLPKTYKAAVITGQQKPLEIQELPMPELKDGEVLLKVLACGIKCLGHEYVGDIVCVSSSEKKWKVGDRVGGAWHGGHDFTCRACSRGQFQMCKNKTINGVSRDGGYGQYATVRSEAAVRIPKDADPAKIAPLLCAGVTVFNGMRNMNITAGDTVAVQGLGGLGHLAIQYARKMGYHTVALSRGTAKKDFAMKLGATDYIDTEASNVGEELQKLGGAACIAVTAPNPDVITPLLEGLAPAGTLLLWTAIGPVPVNTVPMVLNALSVRGWPSGHALDSEEAIAFADVHGVECMIEKFPLEKVNEAMEHMLSGKVRFRAVLTME
ncbi:hypothetical protein LTR37_020555 [Vermiconidia calcicola]|uniref:Uncharacterized protein n=1 Tax=Vermiconidia calcicola TaxID=1690605 RepID=A0ACC3MCG2_9PEZI|nr:hypothetical protein LTR37_020555 [Vermiconidia calcicola]